MLDLGIYSKYNLLLLITHFHCENFPNSNALATILFLGCLIKLQVCCVTCFDILMKKVLPILLHVRFLDYEIHTF